MRKLLLLLSFIVIAFCVNAQVAVTVTNPTNTTPNLQPTYASLALAITDLDAVTTVSGPVTITCAAGSETAPSGGYVINFSAATTAVNNIVITGTATTTITAFGGQTAGSLNDAIFKIIGSDYVTIQNFTMQENASNTTATYGTNNMTEFGVALFYASTSNGAQNNTIQNNTISLNRTYVNTFGIYSNTRHAANGILGGASAAVAGTTVTADAVAGGTNSSNKVYSNAINNVNFGIVFIGGGTTTGIELGNDIGGSSLTTANTITNWGNGAVTGTAGTTFTSLTGNNYCIFSNGQANDNISYNTITSASLTSAVTEGGILKIYLSTAQPTGTITTTINNNTVQVTNNPSAATTGAVAGINNQGLTPLLSTATMSINNNTVQNCVLGGSTSTTNGLTGITNSSLPGTLNVTGNSVINNSITATTATTGQFQGIANSGAAATINLNSNIVRGYTNNTNATFSGPFFGIVNAGAVTTAINMNLNQIGDATANACTFSLATTASMNPINNQGGAAGCTLTINGNTVRGITLVSSGSVTGINNSSAFVGGAVSITNNNIGTAAGNFVSFSAATSSAVTGIVNAGGSSSSVVNINGNTVRGTSYGAATTGSLTGISNSLSGTTLNVNTNTIGPLTFTASAATLFTAITNSGSTGLSLTFNQNTISGLTLTTTGTDLLIVVGSPGGTASVTNNTIQTITNAAASGTMRVITASTPVGLYTVTGNTIDGISYTAATSTGSIAGIYNLSSATLENWNNNIIRNFSTPTTGTLNGIQNNTTSGTFQCKNNQIYNFSTTAGGVGGFSANGITWSNSNVDISGNLIYSINSTGTTGGTGGTINGITHAGAATVTGNAIYDLSSTSTNAAINGININATGTNTISNNLIGDLRAINSTGLLSIAGINAASGTTNNIYHNTVNIAATTSSATTFGTSAIYLSSATPVNNLRNNIFVNTSSPGPTGGFTAAIRYTATPTSTNFPSTSNNNFYYAGTPAANSVIYGEGSTTPATNGQQTISTYKTYINTTLPVAGRESVSVSEVPNFVSTAGSNPITNFLKYNTTIATQIEQGGGLGTGITTDFTGATVRCPGGGCPGTVTTPDMGAWELAGLLLDLAGPSISYTALPNTIVGANQTLTATITDASSVPTSGAGLPVLYWKLNAGSYTAVTGTSIGSNQYTFTFGSATTAINDVISYYIVAQDIATTPNVGAFPSVGASGFSINPPNASTPPTTPSSFTAVGTLSGIKTVGSGGDYATLTGAGGAFAVINANVLSGNLQLQIISDLTTGEDGSVSLNQFSETGVGNYTLKIYPTGAARVVSGSLASGALIKLNGADRVTIDGSIGGSGNDQSLTITNTSATSPVTIGLISLGTGAGATNNTIKNCVINTGSNAATSYAIHIGAATIGTGGADNDNITIQNNTITKAYNAIWANGTASASAGGLDGLNITNNIIGPVTSGATNIGFSGINLANAINPSVTLNTVQNISATATGAGGIITASTVAGATISQNTIQNSTVTSTSSIISGILIGGTSGTYTVSRNTISNITEGTSGSSYVAGIEATATGTVTIDRNNITGINNTSTSTFGAYGINLNGGNNYIVTNNLISNITSDMTGGTAFSTTFGLFGIRVGTGLGHQIYNNSVNLYGLRAGTAASTLLSASLAIVNTTSTGCDVRNNIFANTITGGTTSVANVCVYLPTSGTTAMNLIMNNNAYYTGSTVGVHGVAHVGTTYTATPAGAATYAGLYAASDFTKVGNSLSFKTYTSNLLVANTNNDNVSFASSSAAPFTSTTNLLPTTGSDLIGANIATVTTDYTGAARLNPPAMGAYEVSIPGIWSATAASTVWEIGGNWRDGVNPVSGTVYIPATSTNMPTLSSTVSINRLLNNGTVTISGTNTLSIAGDIINAGSLTGTTSAVTLNGTAAQSVSLTGNLSVQDFTLNNAAGATLSGAGKLNVTGTANVTSGVLAAGGRLTIKSLNETATGTGRITTLAAGAITGNVNIERYILGSGSAFPVSGNSKRGFRFIGHPLSSSIGLSQINATGGVSISGTGGATNGFQVTGTNNPSAFRYDATITAAGANTTVAPGAFAAADAGWVAFTKTDGLTTNAWAKGQGIRFLFRGDQSQGLTSSADYTMNSATVTFTGAINIGPVITALTSSATNVAGYNVLSNPLPSPVDLSLTTSRTNIDANFYVFDPSIGNRGGYSAAKPFASSYILPVGGAFVANVTTLGSAASITFPEAAKVSGQTDMLFRNANQGNFLKLKLGGANMFWDELNFEFGDKYKADKEYEDGAKFINSDVNFYSITKDDNRLSLDYRKLKDGDIIPLGLITNQARSFTIKVEDVKLDAGTSLYLIDKLLNTQTKLEIGTTYDFATTTNAASQGEGRFEIGMKQTPTILPVLVSNFSVKLSPNPATDMVKVTFTNVEAANTTISIVNAEGKTVRLENAGNVQNGQISINVKGLAKGNYYVTLNNGTDKKTEKLVIQ